MPYHMGILFFLNACRFIECINFSRDSLRSQRVATCFADNNISLIVVESHCCSYILYVSSLDFDERDVREECSTTF